MGAQVVIQIVEGNQWQNLKWGTASLGNMVRTNSNTYFVQVSSAVFCETHGISLTQNKD
jgi:hypothetical protein